MSGAQPDLSLIAEQQRRILSGTRRTRDQLAALVVIATQLGHKMEATLAEMRAMNEADRVRDA